MARPRKQTYSMSQYLENCREGYVSNTADTQREPAWKEIIDGLVVTILTDDYIPPLILGEQDSGQTVIVDGGSRTAAFRNARFGNHKIKFSVENSVISYKKLVKNEETGKISFENAEFDIKGKTFDQFPKELQKKFDEYQVETVIHEHCTKEDIARYIKRYNEHKSMNTNQKMFVYVPKFAEKIREIKNRQFFVNCCEITQKEKENGIIERILTETIMTMFHFDNWTKNGKKIAQYVNENSSMKEFEKLEENISRLEKIVISEETKELFNVKNSFVWLTAFENFIKFDRPDVDFGKFLDAFANDLRNKTVDGDLFDEVDDTGSTKDKKCITKKLHIIDVLMCEFLEIKEEPENTQSVEEIISELVEIPVKTVKEDIEIYEETLTDLQNNCIKDGSKLLDKENRISLLAMVAYSYKEDIDLDEWMTKYAEENNTYFCNQKKNFVHMKKDLGKYIGESNG